MFYFRSRSHGTESFEIGDSTEYGAPTLTMTKKHLHIYLARWILKHLFEQNKK